MRRLAVNAKSGEVIVHSVDDPAQGPAQAIAGQGRQADPIVELYRTLVAKGVLLEDDVPLRYKKDVVGT